MKIALCGYLGSGCTRIAKVLASRLRLKTVDTAVNTSGILTAIDDLESLSNSSEKDLDTIIKSRLENLLERDNIVVEGRSAFMLLDRDDVVKIFLNASLEDRIRHVASRRGISIEEARKDAERSDDDRANLHKGGNLTASVFDLAIRADPERAFKIANDIAEVVQDREAVRFG